MPWGRRGFGKVQCVCLQCGGTFLRYRAHMEFDPTIGRFCSRGCKNKWRGEHIRGKNHPHWKGGLVKRSCVICSREFKVKPKELKRKNRGQFCSKDCLYQATRQRFLWNNPTLRSDVRQKLKQKWQDPEFKEATIRAQLASLWRRPTSLEQQMVSLIEREGLPYKYTGDGSFLIGWKNPDFVNTNGAKVCIEVANRYHHPDPWAEKRKAHFAQYGWGCYIFFATEKGPLDEPDILATIERGIEV